MFNKKWYTLVELILSITILAILSTIWFISYSSYLSSSRDSNRVANLTAIWEWLNKYIVYWSLPRPDKYVDIYSWTKLLWKQWYISENILEQIWYEWDARDPLDKTNYSYYLLETKKHFQLMWFLESEENLEVTFDFINKSVADSIDYSNRYPFFYGNKLWILTDSNNNPVQSIESIKTAWKIDVDNTSELLVAHLKNNMSSTWTWSVINKISEAADVKGKLCKVVDNVIECDNLCATKPAYSNTIFTIGNPVVKNTSWQNDDYRKPCYYECVDWYVWDDCGTATYCTTVPTYAHILLNIWTPSQVNQSWIYNLVDGDCTFKCETNYTWNWTDTCEADTRNQSCTWLIANSSWNTVSSITQTWNWVDWSPSSTWVYNETSSTTECRYECSTWYHTEDGWSTCISNIQTATCWWSIAANATATTATTYTQTWDWSAWTPTTNWWENQATCDFDCDTNYTWDGTSCVANTQTATCWWSIATNATATTATTYTQTWDWSAWIPTTNWWENQATCDFDCDTNYTWDGTSCVANTQTATCWWSVVANATATTATTYTQTWDWSAWTPTTNWWENQATCDFDCDAGYAWNWSSCELSVGMQLVYNWLSAWETIQLPFKWTVDIINIDWWDGGSNWCPTTSTGSVSCTYTVNGDYTIKVYGSATWFWVDGASGISKLVEVTKWDSLWLIDLSYAFKWATNLISVPSSLPVWVTNLSYMFSYADNFNQPLNTWDTSSVTDMSYMFYRWTTRWSGTNIFNQPLDAWNTSNVTNMSWMFSNSQSFNQPLNSWDVSSVTNMRGMFYVTAFNQPLDTWSTSNVTDMGYMFYGIDYFNQPLNSWDTSSVTDMKNMFTFDINFNQPLDAWDTSNVTNMNSMFLCAWVFNQPLYSWDVSSVTDMSWMFNAATVFNQSLDTWNTSSVTDMSKMFSSAMAFNQPLNSWDVSSVTDMSSMFWAARAFNQPLNSWDVSNVTNMQNMFNNASYSSCVGSLGSWDTLFNQPLDSWNTSSVTNMSRMFNAAGAFNQPLSSWDTSNVVDMTWTFANNQKFNQNLTCWDVHNIPSTPDFFRDSSILLDSYVPYWWTTWCH